MKIKTALLIVLGFVIGILAGLTEVRAEPLEYCKNMALIDNADRIPNLETDEKVDLILVSKDRHSLYLLSAGHVLKEFKVSFGFGFQQGPKFKEGDGRTPEGNYVVELKNPRSNYHLALKVSYPNAMDIARAKKLKVNPGSDIMIHGLPTNFVDNLVPEVIQRIHTLRNWTQGCIAVTDSEIEQIFSLVQERTRIQICPLTKPRL